MFNEKEFMPTNIKDLIDQDLIAYMPQYYENRRNDLNKLRQFVEAQKTDDILAMTHKILGTARTYGLNELDYAIEKLERFTKESKMEEAEFCLSWAEKYLKRKLANI